jgi:hypothetical protein
MLSVSPQARALIAAKGAPVRLDLARRVYGGCGVPSLEGRPAVRFGAPPPSAAEAYEERSIDGVTVHVPRALPASQDLTLAVASFLGVKRLVVEGWNPLGWSVT